MKGPHLEYLYNPDTGRLFVDVDQLRKFIKDNAENAPDSTAIQLANHINEQLTLSKHRIIKEN